MADGNWRKLQIGNALPLGVSRVHGGVQFAFYGGGREKKWKLHLLDGEEEIVIPLEDYRLGNVRSVCFPEVKFEDLKELCYFYESGGELSLDPYANKIAGSMEWGKKAKRYSMIDTAAFSWDGDKRPDIPYHQQILYQLHVRGFTKDPSSRAAAKGTFQGIIEMIPYLLELGVNGLFLLPCYDFEELFTQRPSYGGYRYDYEYEWQRDESEEPLKLNYWGYTGNAAYFSPKASYAYDSKHPQLEMKEMVKQLHRAGIEVIMDFNFDNRMSQSSIVDCLRFWILEYHIDGFRVNESAAPPQLLATDPIISSVKLLASGWDGNAVYGQGAVPAKKTLAEYNDGFLIDARKLLKSEENVIGGFSFRIGRNPKTAAVINYITSYNGFTLADLVSYDVKHNEENGENGRDGTDYNYSWNCGAEGKTRRKTILSLRKRQMKNALAMLFFSQGTPMLTAGDEFGNSQQGNNNPYCLDSPVSWVNWDKQGENEDIFAFAKKVIAIRRAHPILHKEEEMRGMDYIASGCPDLSFHGPKAWYMDASNYSRLLGVMYNGDYALADRKEKDTSFYIAYNLHWEAHEFALPQLSDGKCWHVLLDTSGRLTEETVLLGKQKKSCRVSARTVVVFYRKE